jgi:hypothetical protein
VSRHYSFFKEKIDEISFPPLIVKALVLQGAAGQDYD